MVVAQSQVRRLAAVGLFLSSACLTENPDWGPDQTGAGSTASSVSTTSTTSATTASTASAAGTSMSGAATDAGQSGSSGTPDGYPGVVLADGPVGYWRLGESAGPMAADEVGDNEGVYLAGVLLSQPGLVVGDNTAARFDGVDDYVRFDHLFNFEGRAAFSAELWTIPDDTDAGCMIGSLMYIDGTGYLGWFVASHNGNIRFDRSPGRTQYAPQAAAGQPIHVVSTYDGYTMITYLNGEMISASVDESDVGAHDDTFTIGYCNQWSMFAGVIDEVAVYDFALPPQRVMAHYEAGAI